jgi:hypothetical protein
MVGTRVSWQARGPFIFSRQHHPSVAEYDSWVAAGAYSAILLDGSLLQITYDVEGGRIVGHRLAYVPCPFSIDVELLKTGMALADVVDAARAGYVALRSPLRFDFDPAASHDGHPAAHMTLNSAGCRIGCVAPIRVLRFLDFVYRHFYPELHAAHARFFQVASWSHAEADPISPGRLADIHLAWDVRASESSVLHA